MDSYIAAGILEPLNAYTDNWDEWGNFTKEYVDMFTKRRTDLRYSFHCFSNAFGYNKALFEEAGLTEPPKTWEEALDMAKNQ